MNKHMFLFFSKRNNGVPVKYFLDLIIWGATAARLEFCKTL